MDLCLLKTGGEPVEEDSSIIVGSAVKPDCHDMLPKVAKKEGASLERHLATGHSRTEHNGSLIHTKRIQLPEKTNKDKNKHPEPEPYSHV